MTTTYAFQMDQDSDGFSVEIYDASLTLVGSLNLFSNSLNIEGGRSHYIPSNLKDQAAIEAWAIRMIEAK